MIELGASALLDPNTTKRCPFDDGLTGARIGTSEDPELGVELAVYRCGAGHEWQEPSPAFVLRLTGWGPRWRWARERLA